MAQFPERKNVIDGSLAAVLAGEHMFLIGPPGTAKSALVRCLAQVFSGSYFERLLTKFSTPEELFGPISLHALALDRRNAETPKRRNAETPKRTTRSQALRPNSA